MSQYQTRVLRVKSDECPVARILSTHLKGRSDSLSSSGRSLSSTSGNFDLPLPFHSCQWQDGLQDEVTNPPYLACCNSKVIRGYLRPTLVFLKPNTALFHVLTSRTSLCLELQFNSSLALGPYKGLGLRTTRYTLTKPTSFLLAKYRPAGRYASESSPGRTTPLTQIQLRNTMALVRLELTSWACSMVGMSPR